jgi:hypothetical protein
MAVAAVTLAGWKTFLQVLKLGLSTNAAGAFVSPLSLYIALVLSLNGAGKTECGMLADLRTR